MPDTIATSLPVLFLTVEGRIESLTQRKLSRITVIVPTYERPNSVRRQFEYWDGRGAKVFILDGSKNPSQWATLQPQDGNVQYLHSGGTFNERRASAAQFITTEFAILLPDDEFHLEAGLVDCVDYLDSHQNVVGCAGRSLGFFVEQNEFRAFLNHEDWLSFPLDSDTVQKRLDFALPPNKAHKVEFSLFRAAVWKEIFSESYSDYYSCGFTYERLLNLHSAVIGRTDLIDSVLWMQSLENPPINSADAPRSGQNNFIAWATSGIYQTEVDHYFNKARTIIESSTELSQQEVGDFALRFLFGGVQRQIDKERRSQQRLSRKLGLIAIRVANKPIKRWAKRLVPGRLLAFTGWRGSRLDVLKSQLCSRGISFSDVDLDRAARLVLKYHHSDRV
jgi:glycosyltransferase domain-containing protein